MEIAIKHIRVLGLALFLLAAAGCEKGYLDKTPANMLTEEELFSNKAAFETHMAFLYSQLPINHFFVDMFTSLSFKTDEMVTCTQDQSASLDPGNDWWVQGYKLIRDLNNMIEKMPAATAFSDENEKTAVTGELRFMRAFAYYNLAWRYGGVPIVTDVLDLPASGDPSELDRPRNSEAEVFQFIEQQLDSSIEMMSHAPSVTPYRFNQWSALAYKSRMMLYAASLAKYGQMQLGGLLGIPADQADHYWTAARDAAKKVMESGHYALYEENGDLVQNYHDLFFDESGANRERIFVVAYIWPLKGHNFDRNAAPFSHRGGVGYGGRFCPTFDMVEDYEYVNSRDGALHLTQNGSPVNYANPADLFKGKDPRFFASVLYPGAPWAGTTLQIYARLVEGGQEKDGHGADGIAQPEATSTGFYLSKWQDPNPPRPIDNNSSDVDRICMRYAEVLLNYAEASLELHDNGEALKYVNQVRARAGLGALGSITRDDYRHERKIELAYEENRYWDLKRWRIYDDVLSNQPSYALWPVFNKDNGTYRFEKYRLPDGKYTRNFTPTMYYNKVPTDVIESNPLVVQNPGY